MRQVKNSRLKIFDVVDIIANRLVINSQTYSVPAIGPAVVVDLDAVLVLHDDLGHDEHVGRILGVDVAALGEVLLGVVGLELLLLLLERHRLESGDLLGLTCRLLRSFVEHLAAGVIDRRQTAGEISELHVGIGLAGTRCHTSLLVHRIVRALNVLR